MWMWGTEMWCEHEGQKLGVKVTVRWCECEGQKLDVMWTHCAVFLCGQVAHETVVKAQVRLQLRDVTGKILQVQRALESTQKVCCSFQKVWYVRLGVDVWSLGILCISLFLCYCVCVCVSHSLVQCMALYFCWITFWASVWVCVCPPFSNAM